MINHKWTQEQDAFICRRWRKMSDKEMAEALGLRYGSVKARRALLGYSRVAQKAAAKAVDSPYFNVRQYRCWLTGEKR